MHPDNFGVPYSYGGPYVWRAWFIGNTLYCYLYIMYISTQHLRWHSDVDVVA